jgi:hypothetical protein
MLYIRQENEALNLQTVFLTAHHPEKRTCSCVSGKWFIFSGRPMMQDRQTARGETSGGPATKRRKTIHD